MPRLRRPSDLAVYVTVGTGLVLAVAAGVLGAGQAAVQTIFLFLLVVLVWETRQGLKRGAFVSPPGAAEGNDVRPRPAAATIER